MNHRAIVTCLIENDGKLLFGRKRAGVGPYPDTWHLIGGGIDEGESVEQATRREILEETGIEVGVVEIVGEDTDIEPNKHGEPTEYHFTIVRAAWKSGEPVASDDIEELRWFGRDDLSAIPLNRPTIKYFERAGLFVSTPH
jgi:bifunctional NMN adenylyltransferase/nudix hydrolase